jgi:hypothetical protein
MTRTYEENNKMVENDARPCGDRNCWCQKDKYEPFQPTGADATITAADKTPMTVEWDKYGNIKFKDQSLGGFETKKPATSITPLAAFFYNDNDADLWDPEETRERDPETGGEKGKKLAELGAIDPTALLELAKVAGYGSKKYSRLNYMRGYAWSLSFDAMMRHLLAFWSGESYDPESGLHHLAHAGWHCMTLMSYDERDIGTDDRYNSGGSDL